MGKMIDAQSIVVAPVATNQHGQEGGILRYVFWHSLLLPSLVGIVVFIQPHGLPGAGPPPRGAPPRRSGGRPPPRGGRR